MDTSLLTHLTNRVGELFSGITSRGNNIMTDNTPPSTPSEFPMPEAVPETPMKVGIILALLFLIVVGVFIGIVYNKNLDSPLVPSNSVELLNKTGIWSVWCIGGVAVVDGGRSQFQLTPTKETPDVSCNTFRNKNK